MNNIKRAFFVLAGSAFLFGCGGGNNYQAAEPPDTNLIWDEGNWDERDWQ